MNEVTKPKRKIIGPKIGGRRINLKRVIPAAALSIGILAGGISAIAKSVSKDKKEIKPEKKVEFVDENYQKLNNIIDPELDDFVEMAYIVDEEIILYVEKTSSESIEASNTIEPDQQINVFNMTTTNDALGNEYLYCEVPDEHIIGLIRTADLSKATKITDKSAEFDSIYQVTNPSVMGKYMQATIGKYGITTGSTLKNGEIIFADKTNLQMDEENNLWMKMRTNDGSVGYIMLDETLEEVQDGILVEVVSSNNVIDVQTDNLNIDVSNMITDVEVGSRLVVVGDGSLENTSRALYFDSKGNAKWGEISNDLIKEAIIVTQDERLSAPEIGEVNDVQGMNENISNWNQDYKNGSYGIDISGMRPEALKQLLIDSPEIEYGIVRLGVTGYGHNNDELTVALNSTVTTNATTKELVQSQIAAFNEANLPVFAYFYATDINPDEGYKIAELVEECIDTLDGNIQPIIDCEVYGNGEIDRMYFINQPNYEQYKSAGGYEIDFDYLKSLTESEILQYVASNPEVQDYINYCQDLKAQSIAATYSKLYQDGYIKGKNAILYTGNKSVSKDSYKATIKGSNGNPFDRIVLFKYDDVVEYLTNPDSPYFISEDFALKVWYADYTGNKNFEMLGEGSVMTQYDGDVFVNEYDCYDKNYACPEFIEAIVEAQKEVTNQQVKEDDDLELG